MKRALAWDEVEARQAIRLAAYDLSRSGMCEGWRDVCRVLRVRFDAEQLAMMFENPLSRLDIDQRCYRARNPGSADNALPADTSLIGRGAEKPRWARKHRAADRETQEGGHLAARILEVLGGDSERTAMELAEGLGVRRNEVFIAVRRMLADGDLQITRYVAAKRGGRGARVFALAAGIARRKDDEHLAHMPLWPADPVVATALDESFAVDDRAADLTG
ncbi:hypothetical protein G3N95_04605 [Paraburkholderia sp. Tr-20389]|uniref:hypothetical protein n=1 Tax=Paraburkholderia sp. Tr-20389 TaxID=2703903 RepID=UPI0019821CCD|nr:hypothetical protein [Paraburkholderia sp. Tr-20389]MBN3752209.1 hypothetical protein [Paraburkholderia sp. Tr-20389]